MDAKAVGQRIKAAREKKSMTQEDLAARINISPTHVSVIERGTKIPRIDTFVAIANVLEVSADELLVDVVNCAANGVASNLSAAIEVLPHEEKMRVLGVVAALIGRGVWKSLWLLPHFFVLRQDLRFFDILLMLYLC